MSRTNYKPLLALAVACISVSARAQDDNTPPPAAVAPPANPVEAAPTAESTVEQLVRVLKERKAISRKDADLLLERLHAEQSRAPLVVGPSAPPPSVPPPPSAGPAPAGATAAAPAASGTDRAGRIRVMHIPESEKQQIRQDVVFDLKEAVMQQAREQNWAQPDELPRWARHFTLDGDMRVRGEGQQYDRNNFNESNPGDTTKSPFVNFQAINSGPPVDFLAGTTLLPLLNTTRDRELFRVRGRLGFTAKVDDDLSAGLRLSTGTTTNAASSNQTLGSDFNKLTVVIDRANLQYKPAPGYSLWAGRMPNPWISTDLVWHNDLAFDGLAAQYSLAGDTWTPRLAMGAFSVENTAVDFPTNNAIKINSRDKFLYGAQLGADWVGSYGFTLRPALAFYYFQHLEGKHSSPCRTDSSAVICNTDDSRPVFVQKGNTMFPIRVIDIDPNKPQAFEYYGLASPFRVANASLTMDTVPGEGNHLIVDLDYAMNLAYDADRVRALDPQNNIDGCLAPPNQTCVGPYHGGNKAFLLQGRYGQPKILRRGDWQLLGGYKHLDSDAVVDAFTDSDFHLGGTNAKGYFIGGSYGFAANGWLTARWLSATEVTGPPLAIDVFQLDLNARF